MKQLKFYEEKLKPKMNNTRKGDEGMEIKIDLRKVAKGDDKMNIEERIVKEKISTGEDLVLCVDNIVFEQDLKCKNISCKSLKKSFKVKGNIDAGNIDAENINAGNINAENIDAGNINAGNIDAGNIDAWNINAENIDAENIDAWNINAENINAENINAGNINAENINALNISYFASCVSQETFKCVSVKGRRDKSIHVCLDNEIEFCKDKDCVAKGDE